jgi:hypothetical protein
MLPLSFISKNGGAKSLLTGIQNNKVTDNDDNNNVIMSDSTSTTSTTSSSSTISSDSNSSTNNNQVNNRGNSPPQQEQQQQQQQHAASELFPYLLHGMLEDVEKVGHSSIVSWTVDGKSFRIHDTEQFVSSFLGRYFSGVTTLIQFRSQLADWGFDNPNPKDNNETFFHPCFQKSDPSLCHYMRCGRKVNNNSINNNKAEDNNNNNNSCNSNRKEESTSTITSKTGNIHTAPVPVVNTKNVSYCTVYLVNTYFLLLLLSARTIKRLT